MCRDLDLQAPARDIVLNLMGCLLDLSWAATTTRQSVFVAANCCLACRSQVAIALGVNAGLRRSTLQVTESLFARHGASACAPSLEEPIARPTPLTSARCMLTSQDAWAQQATPAGCSALPSCCTITGGIPTGPRRRQPGEFDSRRVDVQRVLPGYSAKKLQANRFVAIRRLLSDRRGVGYRSLWPS